DANPQRGCRGCRDLRGDSGAGYTVAERCSHRVLREAHEYGTEGGLGRCRYWVAYPDRSSRRYRLDSEHGWLSASDLALFPRMAGEVGTIWDAAGRGASRGWERTKL